MVCSCVVPSKGVLLQIIFCSCVIGTKFSSILVSRAHDPSGLWLGLRALARPDFLSMRRVFISHSQPIRFARFDGKSVNRGLPVLDQTRALDPNHRPEGSWALGTRMNDTVLYDLLIQEQVSCIKEKTRSLSCSIRSISFVLFPQFKLLFNHFSYSLASYLHFLVQGKLSRNYILVWCALWNCFH